MFKDKNVWDILYVKCNMCVTEICYKIYHKKIINHYCKKITTYYSITFVIFYDISDCAKCLYSTYQILWKFFQDDADMCIILKTKNCKVI